MTNGLEYLFRYRANDALHVAAELHVLVIFRRTREKSTKKGREETVAKREERMVRKDIDDGDDEEETGRLNAVVPFFPPFVRPSLPSSCLSIGHVISTRSILLFLCAHIGGMSRRTYIGYVTSARLFGVVLGHTLNRDVVTYRISSALTPDDAYPPFLLF